jgi:DNA adenine methylase
MSKIQKPFLKWIGGKTQIIDTILSKFPLEIKNYHELFLGGGSVLLALLSLQNDNKHTINGKIYAYDLNKALINVYKNIQTNKDALFEYITKYIAEYDSITIFNVDVEEPSIAPKDKKSDEYVQWSNSDEVKKYRKDRTSKRHPSTIEEALKSKESYYYWLRSKYNSIDKNSIECSALFMIINKMCFRGMYREGPTGFNVPFGNYKKTPTIVTKNDLDVISDLIKDVEFIHCGFNESIKRVGEGDFVYLDPPYAPIVGNSFVGYTIDGFSEDTHKQLFKDILELNKKKAKFVMSNAKVDLVTTTFKDFYDSERDDIVARRAINSKKPGSTTTEVIISN